MGTCASKRARDGPEDKEAGANAERKLDVIGGATNAMSSILEKEDPEAGAERKLDVIDADGDGKTTLLEALGVTVCPRCTFQSALLGPIGLLFGLVLGPVVLAPVFTVVALAAMPSIVENAYKATYNSLRIGIWCKLWLSLTIPILCILAVITSALSGLFLGIVWGGATGYTLFGFCEDIKLKYQALVTDKFAPIFPGMLNDLKKACDEQLPLDTPAFELSPTALCTGLVLAVYGLVVGAVSYCGIALFRLPADLCAIAKASNFLSSCPTFCKCILLPPYLLFMMVYELLSLVAVPVYGTLASGWDGLSETYEHNLKYRLAQMEGAGGAKVGCTLLGDVLGVNGIPNGFAKVGIRVGLACKGEDDTAAVKSMLKPAVLIAIVGYLLPKLAFVVGLAVGGPPTAATYASAADMGCFGAGLVVLGVLLWKLRSFDKKMAQAELL
jgi:hypothetical protein